MMKFLFVGNRAFVLKKMLSLGCNVITAIVQVNSFLEKEISEIGCNYSVFSSKNELIELINSSSFDCLISNGCPYILPISSLKKSKQIFINIHPSMLPDLRGKNPINGALLHDRLHGVTCHHMDDEIDTGQIISQIPLPFDSDNIDLELIYQLSFLAEANVFEIAFQRGFMPSIDTYKVTDPIYYSVKKKDYLIIDDSIELILKKTRALALPNRGMTFNHFGTKFELFSITVIDNSDILRLFDSFSDNQIIHKFDDNILVKFKDKIYKFKVNDSNTMKVGDFFFDHLICK